MHAWICERPTGPDELAWQERPTPEPAPGEVRIAIKAASLNFPDLLTVKNLYQVKPPLPFVPGSEFAGVIEAVSDGVQGFKVGDRVAACIGTGAFATHVCVNASRLVPLSPEISFDDAAAFTLTYGTSHHALLDRGQLRAGETVLVLGASGGVGSSAVQIAKAAGATVIAAASSDEKCAACRALGADFTINYSTASLRDEVKRLTNGRGPDIVYDPVGGDLADPAFRSIAWRGRYLVIGFVLGKIPALPLNLPLLKGASIVGAYWGEFARREPEANARMLRELAQWYAQGKVKPLISARLPMTELKQAFERMGTRQVLGKLVLVNP